MSGTGSYRHVPRKRPVGPNGDWPGVRTRMRDFVAEAGSSSRHQPQFKQPALFFLYDDLADRCEPQPVLGQYPRGFLSLILPWLRCERRELLHLCSGSLSLGEGVRVDLRHAARPDVVADCRGLPFRDESVKAVLCDPPYAPEHAEALYGVDYPRPSHLLKEACRVVRPGGRIGFVHYITPNPPKGAHVVKVFGLSTGFGFPMRAVVIYERNQAELALAISHPRKDHPDA